MNVDHLMQLLRYPGEFAPFYALKVGTKFRRENRVDPNLHPDWPFGATLFEKITPTQVRTKAGQSTFWPEIEMVYIPWSANSEPK
jgi:hypothetical protein